MKKINKYIELTDNISQVIEKYPYLSEVFLDYGLHCVGCFANVFDTIKGGCEIHGMTKNEINSLISDLNELVEINSKKNAKK